MSDLDTQTRMARLRECFPDDQTLADALNLDRQTVIQIGTGSAPPGRHTDVVEKTRKLHEQIQKEHVAGLEAVHYALQTIERIRAGTMTDEQLDNVEQVLQQKADDLNTAYA